MSYVNDHPPEKDFSADYAKALQLQAYNAWVRVGMPLTVLDVGSNIGQWSRAFSRICCTVTAIDSPYMEPHLLEPRPRFVGLDLSNGFDLGERFELAVCLEVAEHLPESSAQLLVKSLLRHSDLVLFSAAAPGQGGWGHINEQPIGYWERLFNESGAESMGCPFEPAPHFPAYYLNARVFRLSRAL